MFLCFRSIPRKLNEIKCQKSEIIITSQPSWTDGVDINIYMKRNTETQINNELQGAFDLFLDSSFLALAFMTHYYFFYNVAFLHTKIVAFLVII